MNAQEVLLYVAMPQGLFLYEPKPHALRLIVASDVRRVTGNQDFVDTAPLDLVFVADHARMNSCRRPNVRPMHTPQPARWRRTCTCTALRRAWRR